MSTMSVAQLQPSTQMQENVPTAQTTSTPSSQHLQHNRKLETRKRKKAGPAQQMVLQDLNNNLKQYHAEKIKYYRSRQKYYEQKEQRELDLVNEMRNICQALQSIATSMQD